MANLYDLLLGRPAQPVPQPRLGYGLAGASIRPMQKSPYERTLRPGETRNLSELQDMLGEVILAAGGGALPGVQGKGPTRQAPARIRPGYEKQFGEWFKGSKLIDKTGKPLTLFHGTSSAFREFKSQAGPNTKAIGDWPGIYLSSDPKTAGGIANFEGRLRGGTPNVIPVHARVKNPAEFGQYRTAEEAIRAGHDGRVIRDANGNVTEVLVFSPEQIKSATGNRGTYDPKSPRIDE